MGNSLETTVKGGQRVLRALAGKAATLVRQVVKVAAVLQVAHLPVDLVVELAVAAELEIQVALEDYWGPQDWPLAWLDCQTMTMDSMSTSRLRSPPKLN